MIKFGLNNLVYDKVQREKRENNDLGWDEGYNSTYNQFMPLNLFALILIEKKKSSFQMHNATLLLDLQLILTGN